MRLQRLTTSDSTTLKNPGVLSQQLLWPSTRPLPVSREHV